MFSEYTLQKYLAIINNHLPASRRFLTDLMGEEEPSYQGKEGNRYRIDKREVLLLASVLDPLDKVRLRLPILVMTDTASDSGAWKVTGKVEARAIAKVLEREMDSEDEVRFFFPHLNELRQKLPTATTVMFVP